MRKKINNQKGSALFMTMMILTSIMTIAFGVANLVVPGMNMTRTQNYSTTAFFAAEAGAERSLWEVRKNNYSLPASDTADIFKFTFAKESAYDVDYASSSPNITMTSNGIYLGARRSVQIQYTQ